MPKTSLQVAAIATATVFLAGCSLPSFLGTSPDSTTSVKPTSEMSSEAPQNVANQIMTAMQNGSSLLCEANSADGTAAYEYYIQGQRFRMDGTVTTEDETDTYHAINDTQFLFTWSDAKNQGVKFAIPSEEELEAQKEKYQQYLGNVPDFSDESSVEKFEDQGYQITCHASAIDETLFTPPSTIEFQDITALMEQSHQQAMPSLTPEQQQHLQETLQQFKQ